MAQEQQFNDFTIEHDFTETPEVSGDFQALPQGDYVFDITFLERSTSGTNNPTVKATFQVAEAEAQINEEAKAYAGQRAWNTYSLLPQSLGRLKKLMVACHASLTSFKASEVLNSRIVATITHRKGEAKPDQDGNLQEARVFANVVNERPLDGEVTVAATPTPPVTKAKPTTNGAATAKPQTQTQARRA